MGDDTYIPGDPVLYIRGEADRAYTAADEIERISVTMIDGVDEWMQVMGEVESVYRRFQNLRRSLLSEVMRRNRRPEEVEYR